jgi:acetolactate synthase-1/2/3 large subunit
LFAGLNGRSLEKVMQRALERTGGDAIADALLGQGIDTVFGLPGVQLYGLFDAFYRAQPRLRVIGTRHEQGAGYMAFGYARTTGRPSVYAVVPGEGMLNASAALATAQSTNAPVLCLTGQVPTSFLDQGRGQLHELPDQLATMRSLAKWAARISTPAQAPVMVATAFRELLSLRQGPVALEMPWDVFMERQIVTAIAPLDLRPEPEPDPFAIAEAARLIQSARAPMIFAGGGAFGASEEILELAELLDAPVVSYRSGRGIVSARHPLQMVFSAAYKLWNTTDLIIAIGTRLEVPEWRWPYKPAGLKSIRIDIDPAEMQRFRADVPILAGAKAGTRDLVASVRKAGARSSGRREAIRQANLETAREVRQALPQVAYLDVIREVLPENGILADDLCQAGFASWFAFPIYRPRTFLSAGYSGNLGAGFPAALGAKVAHPGTPVVSICGDGGFLFCGQELATAVQYGINIVTIIFNNNSYGNVRRDQEVDFEGRVIASELRNPDFVKLGEAYGVPSARVQSAEELRPLLEKALGDNQPWLIEVPVGPGDEASPWPWIMPTK